MRVNRETFREGQIYKEPKASGQREILQESELPSEQGKDLVCGQKCWAAESILAGCLPKTRKKEGKRKAISLSDI